MSGATWLGACRSLRALLLGLGVAALVAACESTGGTSDPATSDPESTEAAAEAQEATVEAPASPGASSQGGSTNTSVYKTAPGLSRMISHT